MAPFSSAKEKQANLNGDNEEDKRIWSVGDGKASGLLHRGQWQFLKLFSGYKARYLSSIKELSCKMLKLVTFTTYQMFRLLSWKMLSPYVFFLYVYEFVMLMNSDYNNIAAKHIRYFPFNGTALNWGLESSMSIIVVINKKKGFEWVKTP